MKLNLSNEWLTKRAIEEEGHEVSTGRVDVAALLVETKAAEATDIHLVSSEVEAGGIACSGALVTPRPSSLPQADGHAEDRWVIVNGVTGRFLEWHPYHGQWTWLAALAEHATTFSRAEAEALVEKITADGQACYVERW